MATHSFGKVQRVQDGLVNVVANLGTGRDKAAHSQYVSSIFGAHQLLQAYENSWLAGAIVDYPAEDATRKGRAWRAKPDQIIKIEAMERQWGLLGKLQGLLVASRLYGGAALYMNTGDADQSTPLVVPSEVKSLVLLTKEQLSAGPINNDIDSQYYGLPEVYTLSSNARQVRIHRSRLVIMVGVPVPGTTQVNNGWGNSVLQSTYEAVQQVDSTMANMASLVFEAKVDVFKFEGLADLFANQKDGLVHARLSAQAAMKGINGAVVIDIKDDYQQKSATFGGLPEVVTKFMDAVSGASRIPVTRLYGRAAVGLSGSGDGDERVYFDRIGHLQATTITPAMALLDECLIWQALGERPAEIFYEWRPLRQLSETERADILVKISTAARNFAGANFGEIIPGDALSDSVVNEMTESGLLPGLPQLIKKYGSRREQGLPDDDEVIE